VAVPVVCFATAFQHGLWHVFDEWQSGLPEQYASLLLQWPAVVPFYPLLFYCIVCCLCVIFGGQKQVDSIWVRGGIYTGVPLSVQYHWLVFPIQEWRAFDLLIPIFGLLIVIVVTTPCLFFAEGLWNAFKPILKSLCRRLGVVRVCVLTAIVCVGYGGLVVWNDQLLTPFFLVFLASLACGTSWAILTYSSLSIYVWKNNSHRSFTFGLLPTLAGFSWLATYLAAWRGSIELALIEYAKLPTENPKCYVCTAAARGHRRVVGVVVEIDCRGQWLIVNDQMRILKAGELSLKTLLPQVHVAIRSLYNWLGPRLARRLSHPLLADLAFGLLKPAEWLTRLTLTVLRVDSRLIWQIYSDGDHQGS